MLGVQPYCGDNFPPLLETGKRCKRTFVDVRNGLTEVPDNMTLDTKVM